MHAQEKKEKKLRIAWRGERGCLMTSKRRHYRRDDKEFAAHEVEKTHGASAVGVGQEGAVMAPCHPSPLGVWVLGHCSRLKRQKRKRLKSSYKQKKECQEIQGAKDFLLSQMRKLSANNPWCSLVCR